MTFPKIVRRKFYQSFKLTVGEVVFLKYRIAWDFVPYISRYTTSLTQSAWRRVELRVRLAINLVSQFITLDQPVTTWLYDLWGYDHIIFVFDFRKHVVISLSTLVTNSHLVTIDIGLAFLGSIICLLYTSDAADD